MTSLKHGPALAEALERALGHRDSATGLVDDELADLVRLAEALEASASDVVPSPDFRAAARQRLLVQMARSARPARRVQRVHETAMERIRLWVARVTAGLAALGLAGAAAASASASALPGDALYQVKQATEAVALQLATNDSVRQHVLLHQADTRLDETARLLEQGRDADVAVAAAGYDETIVRLDVAGTSPTAEAVQSNLRTNEVRLSELLQTAPVRARQGLERALAATQRSLGRSEVSAPIPTSPVAPVPTAISERRQADDAQDRASGEVKSARPADANERAADESHDSTPGAPRGRGVEHRAEATPVDADRDTSEVPDSRLQPPAVGPADNAPPGITVSEGHTGSRANPPPATSQPAQGIAPTRLQQRPVTPRSEPAAGRGRN